MRKYFYIISLILLGSIYVTNLSYAQQLRAEISVILKQMPQENQKLLSDFQQIIATYINSHKWTKDEVNVEIPINIQIFFDKVTTSGYEDNYNIQIMISDNSDVQYFDKRCNIAYRKGDNPIHNESNCTSLTCLIDFYVNLLIADELDKFGHLMGTPYFEKAKSIAEQAKFGMGQYIFGWDQRNDLIQELIGTNNIKFREMKDFYFYGIYYAQEDAEKARKYCSAAVDMIDEIMTQNPNHERCKKFLSAHYIELVDLFKSSEDKKVFEQLLKLDPDNANVYNKYLE
jgi:hypothetical protein